MLTMIIDPARVAICRAAHGRSTPLNQDSAQGQTAAPAIDLNKPETNPSEIPEGFVVVANFHTHPVSVFYELDFRRAENLIDAVGQFRLPIFRWYVIVIFFLALILRRTSLDNTNAWAR